MWFKKIRYYYVTGLWTAEMVANAVSKGKITPAQYQCIVDEAATAGIMQ